MELDILNKEIGNIDKGLENLAEGRVLDVSDLEENVASNLMEIYKRDYFVRGPSIDEKNSKPDRPRYAFAIMKKYGGKSNA